jgi:hypothetical protein
MLRDAYRFFETGDGGFLLVRLDDFMELFPEGYSRHLRPGVLEDLALVDQSGTKWIFLEEDEQFPAFIKLLAAAEKTTQRKIEERITHHQLSGAGEIMALIMASIDPNSLKEIERFCRKDQS